MRLQPSPLGMNEREMLTEVQREAVLPHGCLHATDRASGAGVTTKPLQHCAKC